MGIPGRDMAKRSRINWSFEKGDLDAKSIREDVINAYLGYLIHKYKGLSESEVKLLRGFAKILVDVIPTIDKYENLADDLKEMIEHASHTEAERSDVKIEDEYPVYYDDNVEGITTIPILRSKIRELSSGKMRGVGYGANTPASKSYSLLTGEIYQHAARIILSNMAVLGYKVRDVKLLMPSQKSGRRVDDWEIILSNESKIPVEVKSSRNVNYFNSAFDQIKNTLSQYPDYPYALFIGFLLSNTQASITRKVIVIIVNKADSLNTFRAKIEKMLST